VNNPIGGVDKTLVSRTTGRLRLLRFCRDERSLSDIIHQTAHFLRVCQLKLSLL